MMTDVPSREIFRDLDGVEMKVKLVGKKAGALSDPNICQVVRQQMTLEVL